MKFTVAFIVISFLFALPAGAQAVDSDSLFSRMGQTWEEISFNCSSKAVDYFQTQQYDSLELLLDYWSDTFGFVEPVARMNLLYDISTHSLTDSSFGEEIIDFLLDYKQYVESEQYALPRQISFYPEDDEFPVLSEKFDAFTVHLADTLLSRVPESSSQFLLCRFYRNDFAKFFKQVKSPEFSGSSLATYYAEYLNGILRTPEHRAGILTGTWLPHGKNRLLGNHPEIGGFYEYKRRRWLVDVVLAVRFLKSKEAYLVKRNEEVITTNDFFGFYAGVEFGQVLLEFRHFAFYLSAGVGVDLLDAIDTEIEEEKVTLSSLNMNLGAAFRFYPSSYRSNYFGFQYRIHYLDYRNKGGSDLSGNAANFRLMVGVDFSSTRKRLLKMLGY